MHLTEGKTAPPQRGGVIFFIGVKKGAAFNLGYCRTLNFGV